MRDDTFYERKRRNGFDGLIYERTNERTDYPVLYDR
jgi:hypothetical protein